MGLPHEGPCLLQQEPAASRTSETYSVGSYLAARLEEIGVKHHFALAGDYNLVLLDRLLLNENIEQVYCCNELNLSFSAEGYARANGVASPSIGLRRRRATRLL
jgi:hypothetical protein